MIQWKKILPAQVLLALPISVLSLFTSTVYAKTTCAVSCVPPVPPSIIDRSGLEFDFYAGASQNTTSNTSGITFSSQETDTLTGANNKSSSFVPGVGVTYNYVMPEDYFYFHTISLGMNYYHTGMSRNGQVYQYGNPQFNNYTYKMGINSNRVMLDAEIAMHPLWHGLTIFGEAGAGGSLNTMSYDEKSVLSNGGELDLGNHTKLSFASEFGGGIKMPVTNKSEVSLRYLYANLGQATSNKQSDNQTGKLQESISTDVVSQSILLGYAYHVK